MTTKARKTGKRTLALLMTVLMLMSAWVFVAPTEAEAATDALTSLPSSGDISGYYKVTSNTTISGSTSSPGLTVTGTTVIYIASGVTLTVNGGNASGSTSGKAGIHMNSGTTLIITGPGSLAVNGGDGAKGGGGSNASHGQVGDMADGGAGGAGGGGGGAGIGGDGGNGGAGGAGNDGDANGAGGSDGSDGGAGQTVYILNSMPAANISLDDGSNGDGGSAGDTAGASYPCGSGGGGAGGGGGYGGAAIGGGGGGAGGGGAGGGGGYHVFGANRDAHGGYGGKGANNGHDGGGSGSYKSGGAGGAKGSNGSDGTFYNREHNASTAPSSAKGTVTFNKNNGTGGTNSITCTIGYAMTTGLTLPTRTGYDFAGYYTSATGGTQYYDANGNSAHVYDYKNLDLYAHWTPHVITTTLNKQNGSGGTTTVYHKYQQSGYYSNSACTTSLSSITKPTRIGYIFDGYYSSTNGAGTQYITSAGAFSTTNNLYNVVGTNKAYTLYAKWNAKNVTVTFKNNDGTAWDSGTTHTGKYDKTQKDGNTTIYTLPSNNPTVVTDVTYNGVTYDSTDHWTFDKWVVYSAKQYSVASDTDNTQTNYTGNIGQDPLTAVLKGDTVFIATYKEVAHDYTGAVVSHNNGTHSWMCTKGCGTYGTPSGGKNATTSCDDTMVWTDLAVATCGHNGYQTGTCSVCNYTTQRSTPALVHSFTGTVRSRGADGHDWPCVNDCGTYGTPSNGVNTVAAHNWSWNVNPQPTCTTAGSRTRTCSVCGYSETEAIAPTGVHTGVHHAAAAATCQAAGNIEYWQCSVCNKFFSDSACTTEITTGVTIARLPHSYTGNYVNNHDGTHSRLCVNGCNQPGDTQNCAFSDWATNTAASCTGGGTETRTCQYCGYGESRNTGAQGHSLTRYTEATPATCVNTGLIETWYCSRCNKYFADYNATQVISNINTGKIAPIDSTNHASAVRWVAEVPATCTAAGTAGYYTCDSCLGKFSNAAGTTTVTPATIPSHGHNYIWSSATYGWNATHTTCTATAVCSYDQNHKDYVTVNATTNTTPATCLVAGATTYTANFNGQHGLENQTYMEVIPATGHNMDGSNVSYSWTQNGNTYTCIATETCANSGCTHTETRTGVVTKGATTATCTAAGTITYTATFPNTNVPNDTKTVSDSALGHSMTVVPAKTATCMETGNNLYYVCDRCGNVYKDENGNTATTVAAETIAKIPHDFSGVITSNGDGTHDIACAYGCGTTDTVNCTYNQNVASAEYKKQDADCMHAHQYYLSCQCGQSSQGHTNAYFEIGDALGHNWDYANATFNWSGYTCATATVHCLRDNNHTKDVNTTVESVTTPATCDATGSTVYTAKFTSPEGGLYIDTKTETISIDSTAHNWVNTVDPTHLKSAATCASPAVYYKSCSLCGVNSTVDTFTSGAKDPTNHEVHVMKWISAPTCTTDGQYVEYCTACNTELGAVQTMPAGHHYNQGDVTTQPTCGAAGEKTFTCSVCSEGTTGHSFTVPVPATGNHTYTTSTHDATCTTPAWSEQTCSVCGDHKVVYSGAAALGHHFVPDTTHNANGVDGGKLYLKCDRSGCTATLVYDLPVTADVIELVSVTPATCQTTGSANIRYKINGNSSWQTTTLTLPADANAHNYAMDKSDPTCTAAGYYQLKCQNTGCTATTGRVNVAALGHHYVQDGADPTISCTTTGNRTYTCDRTGCSDSFTVPLGYAQHNYSQLVSHTAPTCTQSGYDTYKCPNCNTTIDKIDMTAPATGHNYVADTSFGTGGVGDDGKIHIICSVCSKKLSFALPDDTVTYTVSSVSIVTRATCSAAGTVAVTLSGSDGSSTTLNGSYTDANAHDYNTYYTAPTCTTTGSYETKCTLCNAARPGTTTVTLDALGHNWQQTTAATCAADGSEECSRCHQTQAIPKLQHSYGAGVEAPATCTTAGSVTFTCQNTGCTDNTPGHTLTVATSTTPHTFTKDGTHHDATCTTPGYYEVICNVCDAAAGFNRYVTSEPALGHNYIADTSKGTNGVSGGKLYLKCDRSGCTETKEFTLPTDVDSASVSFNVVDATCAAAGSVTITYTVNGGAQQTKSYSIPQNSNHPGASLVTRVEPATCTAAGRAYTYCNACQQQIGSDAVIAKLPHTYNLQAEPYSKVDGTCTTDGSKTFRCIVCQTEASEVTVNTGRGGHNYVAGTKVAATCTTPAYTPYTCSVCNDSYNKYHATEDVPLGHSWDLTHAAYNADGTKLIVSCIRCPEKLEVTIPAFANITSVAITSQPTCTADGQATVTYTENGQTKTAAVVIPSNPAAHSALTTTITTQPGCESTGTVTTQCTACNTVINTVEIPAKRHDWSFPGAVTTPATCQTAEVRTITCSKCTAIRTITGSTVAHSYTVEQPAQAHAADCTSMAYKVYKCQWCDATTKVFDEAQPATDHNYVFQSVSHGTVTVKCSRCEEGVLTFSLGEDYSSGHNFTTFTVETYPTCTTAGKGILSCSNGDRATIEVNIPVDSSKSIHRNFSHVIQPASCAAAGSDTIVCADCGTTISTVELPKLNHIYDVPNGTITTPATCTTAGVRTFTCSLCNGTVTTPIPATNHHYVAGETHAATCMKPAYTTYTCDNPNCTESYDKYDTATYAAGHNYTWTYAHGYAIGTCTNTGCSNSVPGHEIRFALGGDANGHTYTAAVTPATCTAVGSVVFTCTDENCTKPAITVELPVDPMHHTALTAQHLDPTCTNEGYDKVVCTACNAEITSTTLTTIDHQYLKASATVTPATCTATGTRTYKCTWCNSTVDETIPKVQHSYVAVTPVAATCTTPAYTPYHCANCDAGYNAYDTNNVANGHSLSITGVSHGVATLACANCDYTTNIDLNNDDAYDAGHNYSILSDVQPATCQAAGSAKLVCSDADCNAYIDIVIPVNPNAHAFTYSKVDPTCTVGGRVTCACTNEGCDYSNVIETFNPKGHTFTQEAGYYSKIDATCTTEGSITYTCKDCDATMTETLPKVLHVFHQVGETVPATCLNSAYKVMKCDNCTEIYKEYVPSETAVPHDYEWTFERNETNYRAKGVCSVCGDTIYTDSIPLEATYHYTVAITTAPTCHAAGEATVTCTEDNTTFTLTIPAIPGRHPTDKISTVYTAPTCLGGGSIVTTCTECSAQINTQSVPAVGHQYGAGVVTTPPTCIAEGVRTYTCPNCAAGTDGHTYTEPIAKVQHVFEKTGSAVATCLTQPYDTYTCTQDGCSERYFATTGNALGHHLVVDRIENGTLYLMCDRDGCEYTESHLVGETSGYAYDTFTVTEKPTCMVSGIGKLRASALGDASPVITVTIPSNSLYHSKVHTTYTAATCQSAGSVISVCQDCNATLSSTTIAQLQHHWMENTALAVNTPPTCTEAGLVSHTYVCDNTGCSDPETHAAATLVVSDTLPATGHSWYKVSPTCTADGYIQCAVCEGTMTKADILADDTLKTKFAPNGTELDRIGHEYGAWYSISDEKHERMCVHGCGDKQQVEHSYGEGVVTTPATCTGKGVKVYTCADCGHTYTDTISALGHDFTPKADNSNVEVIPSTCETVGYTITTCTREGCGAKKWEQTAPVSGHTWSPPEYSITMDGTTCVFTAVSHCTTNGAHQQYEIIRKEGTIDPPATCETDGLITYECTFTNPLFTTPQHHEVVIPATGHALQHHERVEPTCTEPGSAEYWQCTNDGCGKCFSDEHGTTVMTDTVLPALGHNFVMSGSDMVAIDNGDDTHSFKCSRCNVYGAKIGDHHVALPDGKVEHVYNDWIIIANATCTDTGLRKHICRICDHVETENIPMLPHSLRHYSAKNATCLADGNIEYYYCSMCKRYFTSDAAGAASVPASDIVLPKLPHSYTGDVKNNGDGTHSFRCVNGCNLYGGREGHDFTSEESKREDRAYLCSYADCENPLRYYRSCAVCSAVGTETFDVGTPLGHTWLNFSGQPETCYSDGHTPYQECERCHIRKGFETINDFVGHGTYPKDSDKSGSTADGTISWEYHYCDRMCGDYYMNLTIVAKDSTGTRVPNVNVTITNSAGQTVDSGKTNTNAEFKSSKALREGTYTVSLEYIRDGGNYNTHGTIKIADGKVTGSYGKLTPYGGNASGSIGGNPTTGFRCSMCDMYDSAKNIPVYGWFISIIHAFVHAISRIGK